MKTVLPHEIAQSQALAERSLLSRVLGWLGLSLLLTAVGVLSSAKLREWRRYAIVGIAIFAAVITPSQDWFTMSAMMLPLIVFYELSILVSRLLLKR